MSRSASGATTATVTIAETTNEPSHCTALITACRIGTTMNPPMEKPVPRMPTARPRFRSNQRETSVWNGMKNIMLRKTAATDW